jgi:riboflavin kinase/FMN adenylyltransferase
MKVYYSLDELPDWKCPVLTQGTFDGVHLGHKELIENINNIVKIEGGESVVLTYFPHPRLVLNPKDNSLRLLNTLEERIELLRNAGIKNLIVLEFNEALAGLTPTHFIEDILINKIGAKRLIVGYDHRFGRNRAGSIIDLREYEAKGKFGVFEIEAHMLKDIAISSTKIRAALNNGNVEDATKLLGYDYPLSGTVVEGKRIGREIGFPTANISVEADYKLIPKDGVYYVKVLVEEEYFDGLLSIGNNPTVNGQKKSIEVHLLKFEKEIYGQKVKVVFKKWIRGTKKFVSLQNLKTQIGKDKEYVEQTFL